MGNPLLDDLEDPPSTRGMIHAHYESIREDNRRGHLGASGIGHKCDRKIWFDFRWVGHGITEGRVLRLLERGNREEAWVVDDLRAIGVTIWDKDPDTGEQIRVKWGHFGGSSDGVVVGLVEKPDEPGNFECKTANLKNHNKLKDRGVKRVKPEHWAQMQVYMEGLDLSYSFYVSVCKDNDEIYTEFVKRDRKAAAALVEKGVRLSLEDEAPPVMASEFPPCVLTSKDGTKWPCEYHSNCYGKTMPRVSCRTCVHITPHEDGTWTCDHGSASRELSLEEQLEGCKEHTFNPTMVNATPCFEDGTLSFIFDDGDKVECRPQDSQ